MKRLRTAGVRKDLALAIAAEHPGEGAALAVR
ncbi:MAG: hypothetical protein QOF04_3774, partial [Solirubrobacteraceae bacterium]|nr:hypothetical protein [Solirubrobacteraceae bacterium]